MATHHFHPSHYHTAIGSHEPVLRIRDGDTVVTTTVDSMGKDMRDEKVTPAGNLRLVHSMWRAPRAATPWLSTSTASYPVALSGTPAPWSLQMSLNRPLFVLCLRANWLSGGSIIQARPRAADSGNAV
jgi:hypothetical protein